MRVRLKSPWRLIAILVTAIVFTYLGGMVAGIAGIVGAFVGSVTMVTTRGSL